MWRTLLLLKFAKEAVRRMQGETPCRPPRQGLGLSWESLPEVDYFKGDGHSPAPRAMADLYALSVHGCCRNKIITEANIVIAGLGCQGTWADDSPKARLQHFTAGSHTASLQRMCHGIPVDVRQ